MKKGFSFSSHVTKTYSLTYTLLAALIGGDFKIGWLEIVCKIIAEVQIISIILAYSYRFLGVESLDTFNQFFKDVVSWLTFNDLFTVTDNSSDSNAFLGIVLAYVVILILYILAIITAFYLKKNLPPIVHKIWVNMSVLHFTVIFLLIHQFSLAILYQAHNNQVYLLNTTNSTFFIVIGAFITVFNILFGLAMSRFVYEPIKSQYIAAIRSTAPDLLGLSYKTIDVFLLVFLDDLTAQKFIRLALMVVFFTYRLYIYVMKSPYYYYQAMIIFQGFNFAEFGLVLLNFIIILVNEGKTITGSTIAYMAIIVVVFFLKMNMMRIEFLVKKYGLRPIEQVTTRDDFYKKLFAVDYILEYGSISAQIEKKSRENFTEFQFYGVIKAHKVKCKKPDCGCNFVLEKGKMAEILPVKEDQRKLMREFKFSLIQDLFESFRDPEVKVTLANFLYENKTDAYAAAITTIHSLNLDEGSLELKIISVKLLEKIEKKILSDYLTGLDVQKVVDYQNLSYDLRRAVEKSILNYIKFWDIYKGAEPNVQELYNLSVQVNKESERLAQIWDNITKNYSRLSYKDHLLYGLYLSLTRASPYTAEKTLQKFFSFAAVHSTHRQKDIMLTSTNISDPQNVLIYITMQKEKIGTISFATRNIEDLLGYSSFELIDKNVNELMSRFYRERHTKLLLRHINQSKISMINKNRQIFIRKKDGYVLPAVKFVSIFPYFQKQLFYVGIIRPIPTYDEFILVQDDGIIDSYTANIAKQLNLHAETKRRPRLKYICPELANMHLAFNYLRKGQYSQLRTMSFSKKDFILARNKGSSTMQSRSMYSQSGAEESNASFSETGARKSGLTRGESRDLSVYDKEEENVFEELENENEFDDWRRIYELFISTGVPVTYRKYDRNNKGAKIPVSAQFEFTTIIMEEAVLGSHLRVYRLQTTTADNEHEDEPDFHEEEIDITQEDPNLVTPLSVIGAQENLLPQGLAARKVTVPLGWDKAGPMGNSLSVIRPDARDSSVRNEMDISGNFDLSAEEQHEVSAFTDETMSLRNPFSSQGAYDNVPPHVLRERLKGKIAQEARPNTDTDFNLMTESDNMLVGRRQMREAGQARGVQLMMDPTLERSITGHSFKSIKSGLDGSPAVIKALSSSELKQSMEQKSENKANLKRFFEAHKILHVEQGNVGGGERSSTQSSAQSARINSKVERAIYTAEIDRTIRPLNWIVLIYCVMTSILLIYDQIITGNNLDRLRSNVEVQKFSTQRLYLIVEITRRARVISIVQEGLVPAARLDDNGDAVTSNLEYLFQLANNLSEYNTDIRLSINKIDAVERERFYEEIPVKERGDPASIRYMNSFDTCTEIVNSAIRLKNLGTSPASDDPDLQFILENTLNDLVLKNEEVATILLDDNNISLQNIETTIFILLIIIAAIAMFIFLVVLRSEIRFARRKTVFMDSFFRIKDQEIEENLLIVNAFSTSLLESDREDLFMQKVADDNFVSPGKKYEAKTKQQQHREFKAKSANMKGLEVQTYFNLSFLTVFVAVFIAIFGILLSSFFSHKTVINKLMLRVVNTNIKLFQFGLILTSLYEYVIFDGTTNINDVLIGPEWERNYNILTQSVDFFSAFNDQSGSSNAETLYLLNGDLCPELFSDRDCYNEANGIGSRGILGINGFLLKGLRRVKDFYDNSQKTTDNKTTALTIDDFLNCEVAYYYYTTRSYSELDTLLSSQFYTEVDGFSKSSLIICIVGILVIIIVVKLIWLRIIEKMEDERKSFRALMRMIPVNVIMNNRYLKNYLISNSQGILDSVKNRI